MAVILGAVYIHTHDNLVKEKEISIEYALLNIQKKIGKLFTCLFCVLKSF